MCSVLICQVCMCQVCGVIHMHASVCTWCVCGVSDCVHVVCLTLCMWCVWLCPQGVCGVSVIVCMWCIWLYSCVCEVYLCDFMHVVCVCVVSVIVHTWCMWCVCVIVCVWCVCTGAGSDMNQVGDGGSGVGLSSEKHQHSSSERTFPGSFYSAPSVLFLPLRRPVASTASRHS